MDSRGCWLGCMAGRMHGSFHSGCAHCIKSPCKSIPYFLINAGMNLNHVGAISTTHLCPSSLGETEKWSHAVNLFVCDSFSSRFGSYVKWKLCLNAKKENKKTDSKVSYFGEELRKDSRVNEEKVSESPLYGVRELLPKYEELNSSLKLVKPVLDAECVKIL